MFYGLLSLAGLHFQPCTEDQLLRTAFQMANVIEEEVRLHPAKQVIIRNTLPQHFHYFGAVPHGYYDPTAQGSICWKSNKKDHFTNYYTSQIADLYGFKFLNSAPVYMERWDLHFPKHKKSDCSHWCYTPEIYVPELSILNQLLQ